ncbi:MAG: hypothetical protein SFW08_10625 [Gemmatimonadaceae bacterium]|nr:hypothetical protein [Gemmatimonadaceae bacterium]
MRTRWLVALAAAAAVPLRAQGAPDSTVIRTTVLRYIDALAARDTSTLRALSWPWAISVGVPQPGDPSRPPQVADVEGTIRSVAARRARWEGRVWQIRIEQDGDLAAFTAPFAVWLDGRLTSCGVDRYTLVRGHGTWRVAALHYTQQRGGCTPPVTP